MKLLFSFFAYCVLGVTATCVKDEPERSALPSFGSSARALGSRPCTGSTHGWVDVDGYGCEWWETNDSPGCPQFGYSYAGPMGTAKDNCRCCFATGDTLSAPRSDEGQPVCAMFDQFDDATGDLQDFLGPDESSQSPLFQLPGDAGVGSNIIQFLSERLVATLEGNAKQGNGVLLPTVVRADDESVADAGADVDACGNLDVVNIDTFAFGFEETSSGIGICAAFNPCTHLYAVSQTGIPVPPFTFTIAKVITIEANVLAFSLEKGGLVHNSTNKMWSGDGAEYLSLPGHFYLSGTGSMGVKMSERVSATVVMDAELLIDADPNNNGLPMFQPMGESSASVTHGEIVIVPSSEIPNVDFALLASGTQSAEITLKTNNGDEFTVDLGDAIQSKKDLYIKVDDTFIEVQYASGVDISLQGLCALSDALSPLCVLFGDSGITGRMNAFFNTHGDFGLMLAVEGKFELDISGGTEAVEEIMEDLFGNVDISFEGSAEVSMDLDDGNLELCLNLNEGKFNECLSFCKGDSDCADDKFCNPLLGMCRPKRNNGFFPCIKDSQCMSERCVDTTRTCAGKKENDEFCVVGKECKSGTCASDQKCAKPCSSGCSSNEFCNTLAGNVCRPKRGNGFMPCIANSQCNSGTCASGMCGKLCSSGCSSNEFCNTVFAPDICRPKQNNGFSPCISDAQCNSGRCTDTTRKCASKKDNGTVCVASKECKSGTCASGMCGKRCSSGCSSNEFCNTVFSPDICRPKQNNGFLPCISDAQCNSGRCTDTTRKCASKKNDGTVCVASKECKSGTCAWGMCGGKQNNGFWPCSSDAQCKSGRCVDTTRKCQAKKGCKSSCASGKECQSGRCRVFRCKC